MSLIEGFGDEVIFCFVICIAVVIAAIITLSNYTPGPQVHILRARIHRVRVQDRANNNLRQGDERVRAPFLMRNIQNNQSTPGLRTEESLSTETVSNSSGQSEENSDPMSNLTPESISIETHILHDNITIDDAAAPSTNAEGARASEETATNAESSNAPEEATVIEDASPEEQDQNDTPTNNETAPGEIRVRLKYLDDTERVVNTTPTTTIGDFKKKHFQEDIRNNKIVRLIFSGRLLHNSATVESCRIADNSVVHVQVLAAPAQQNAPAARQEELDVGRFFWPIITVILGLCWMAYFKYPEFYNSLSLGILFVFSGCFCYYLSRVHD